jgi:hypothetical protein
MMQDDELEHICNTCFYLNGREALTRDDIDQITKALKEFNGEI